MSFYRARRTCTSYNKYYDPSSSWNLKYNVPAHTRHVVQGIGFSNEPQPTGFGMQPLKLQPGYIFYQDSPTDSAKSGSADIFALMALAVKGDKFITKKGVIHVYDGERWIKQKKVLEPPIDEIRINALVDAMLGY